MLPCAPDASIRLVQRGGHGVPDWLGPQDHGWLQEFVEEHERFVGKPRRELVARLREPFTSFAPRHKRILAGTVLARLVKSRPATDLSARIARESAAVARAQGASRAQALERAAAELRVRPDQLEAALLADLPGERLIEFREPPPDSQELALRANLVLAQSLLQRALFVTLTLEGQSRAVIRQAHLKGLLCACDADGDTARITISGPLALHRRTTLYGRALAELAAILPWTARFHCEVRCVIRGCEELVVLRSGDPLRPGPMPRRHDSKLEAWFAKDFARLAPDWHVLREPAPLRAHDAWVFPDFLLRHRTIAGRECLLEIVGFWTQEYLRKKLAQMRAITAPRLILCIDEARGCSPGELPQGTILVPFRRRIDAAAVLAALVKIAST